MISMVKKDIEEGIVSLKSGQDNIKRHLCRVADFIAVSVKDNREMAYDIIYITNQIGCHDSWIKDHERDLK